MMRPYAAVVIACCVLALGCAGSDAAPFCGDLDGTYLSAFEEVSGNCGPLSDRVERFDPDAAGGGADVDGCEIDSDVTDNGCRVDYSSVCEVEQQGARAVVTETGSTDWVGIDSAEGIFEIELHDAASGDILCRSVYEVTITRQ